MTTEPSNTAGRAEAYQLLLRETDSAAWDTLRLARDSRPRRDAQRRELCEGIGSRWTVGWDYWDAVTFALQQNGLHLLKRSAIEDDHSKMREALLLLHCSATVTFQEIGALLQGGLWAGAAARWRALHEVAVTASVIAASGTATAERYLDHGYVVQTRRLSEYMQAHGRGPVDTAELAVRIERSEAISLRHTTPDLGVRFRDSYGWAAPLMPMGKKDKRVPPSFDRLEDLADLKDLRLLVASAHGLVHNDAAGVITAVLADPGHWALGPVPSFTETVARPALITIQRAVATTHGAFEPELNDFARLLGMFASVTIALGRHGVEAFEPQEPG